MVKILRKWNKLSLVHKILFVAYAICFENILLAIIVLRPIHRMIHSYSPETFGIITKIIILPHWFILFPFICYLIFQKGK